MPPTAMTLIDPEGHFCCLKTISPTSGTVAHVIYDVFTREIGERVWPVISTVMLKLKDFSRSTSRTPLFGHAGVATRGARGRVRRH